MKEFFKVNEIFGSFQGEGLNLGKPCTFIRLQGCNLSCTFCDEHKKQDYMLMDLVSIVENVNKLKNKLVVITGGEPTLHLSLIYLIKDLLDAEYLVQLETNGSMPICAKEFNSTEMFDILKAMHITISPKMVGTPSVGVQYKIPHPPYHIDKFFTPSIITEVKIVVDKDLRNKYVVDLIARFRDVDIPIWLQPEGNKAEAYKQTLALIPILKANILHNRFDNCIRIGIQAHKVGEYK